MDRVKVFDRALLGKQIGGNGIIVIIDVTYLITGVFFGQMDFTLLYRWVLAVNMLATCILYHNFIVSRGDMCFELNTEKIVYYPTTRFQFLINKYAKTIIFLVIQLSITLACLGLGYFGSRGGISNSQVIESLLVVYIGVLLTSGVAILVMHTMPLGIYFSMLLYYPLTLFAGSLEKILNKNSQNVGSVYAGVLLIVVLIAIIWLFLLWVGGKIYEKVS